jgi:CubicO group peptidase (beta-lactamase class C family)
MQRLVNNGSPPGMSFVVVKDGRIVYSKGFGWADHPRKVPATPETVYHWWSCTKIPTAIAILQLQEMGKLQIDDPVSKYLPFFNVQYPSTQSKAITIRNLLTHSSGLPEPGMRIVSWIHHDGAPSVNQTELVQRVLPEYSKLVFEPGDHSEYTNLGYMVLGAIIEKVTGRAYEEYVKEHILDPLEMKHTAFLYTEAMGPHEACGSHPIFNIYTPLVPFIGMSYVREISGGHLWFKRVYNDQTPPTGLIGSATDAARLVAAYMSGGQLDGRRILSRESITVMTREGHTKGKDASPQSKRRQGIGWQVNAGNGRMFLQHEGGGLGFRTIIRLYPDENLGFVLFNNDVTCENWGIIDLAATLTW